MTEEKKEAARQRAKKYYEVNKDKKKAYQLYNKEKIKTDKQKYYQEHKKEFYQRNKKYIALNTCEIREKEKKYRFKVKQSEKYLEIKKQRNNLRKKKRLTNSLFRIKSDIRSIIGKAFRNHGYSKNTKTQEILGCSFEEFKVYIESKWEPWMNWENRGKYNGQLNYGWDIDHIIPLETAKNEEELIKLNHYTNLQPLCSKVNRHIKWNKKA